MNKTLSSIVFDLPNRTTVIRQDKPCAVCGETNELGYYTLKGKETVFVGARHELIGDYKPCKKKLIKGI